MFNFSYSEVLPTLTFLLTLVFVASILRTRRAPGSTLAWLLIILISPYIGIPLYLFLGGRKFPSKLTKKHSLFKSSSTQGLSGIQRILSVSGIPTARYNKSIKLLSTGVMAYDRYMALINGAQKSIYVTTFIFGNDPVGNAILEALSNKAKSGVDVRVIVDSFGAVLIRHPSLLKFKDAQGKIAYFMPLLHLPLQGRTNLRNHRKLLVVDGKHSILGGMNLANEYMGPDIDHKRWTDLALEIEGSSVDDLMNVFFQDWNFAIRNNEERKLSSDFNSEHTGVLAQVVPSGPDVSGDPIYDVLLSSIHSSSHEIVIITPYFIPDESLAKALELAAKRGVRVRILTPRKSNHLLADIARGSFIRQLEGYGVDFSYYQKMIHAKVFMIDNKMALLGSANFDMRSLLLNYELGLLVYDDAVLKEITKWAEARFVNTTKGYKKDNFFRGVLEGIGRVIGPFI